MLRRTVRTLIHFTAFPDTAHGSSIAFAGPLKGLSQDQAKQIVEAYGFEAVSPEVTTQSDFVVVPDSMRDMGSELLPLMGQKSEVISEKEFRGHFLKRTDDPAILSGRRVAITGSINCGSISRSEAEHFVRYFGGSVTSAVGQSFDILVQGSSTERDSIKLQRARAEGALIVDAEDFTTMVVKAHTSIGFRDRRVAFTGGLEKESLYGPLFTRDFAKRFVVDLGGSVTDSISGAVDLLVIGNDPSNTKIEAAEKSHVHIIRGSHFVNAVKNTPIRQIEGKHFLAYDDNPVSEESQREIVALGGRLSLSSRSTGMEAPVDYLVCNIDEYDVLQEQLALLKRPKWEHTVPISLDRLTVSLQHFPSAVPEKAFCLQGKFESGSTEQLSNLIQNWGGRIAEKVSAEVDYLVVPEERVIDNEARSTVKVVSEQWIYQQLDKLRFKE